MNFQLRRSGKAAQGPGPSGNYHGVPRSHGVEIAPVAPRRPSPDQPDQQKQKKTRCKGKWETSSGFGVRFYRGRNQLLRFAHLGTSTERTISFTTWSAVMPSR